MRTIVVVESCGLSVLLTATYSPRQWTPTEPPFSLLAHQLCSQSPCLEDLSFVISGAGSSLASSASLYQLC